MKEDIPAKFWKEYEKADFFDKEKKLKHIVSNIDELHSLKNSKLRKRALLTSLRDYFNDLIDYMNSKKGK